MSIRCPWPFGPVSEGPWGQPAVLGDLHSGLRPGFVQLSHTIRGRARGSAESNTCPW